VESLFDTILGLHESRPVPVGPKRLVGCMAEFAAKDKVRLHLVLFIFDLVADDCVDNFILNSIAVKTLEHCKKYELAHLLLLPFKVSFCGIRFRFVLCRKGQAQRQSKQSHQCGLHRRHPTPPTTPAQGLPRGTTTRHWQRLNEVQFKVNADGLY
jgi:hypothetical protein